MQPEQFHFGTISAFASYIWRALRVEVGSLKTQGFDPPEMMVTVDQSGYQRLLKYHLETDVVGL